MSRCTVVLTVICCLLFATGSFADVTIDPDYNLGTDTWNYEVTMDSWQDVDEFYVYMDPNMQVQLSN